MLIGEDAINHWIENFFGYGSWESGIWLISYEESGGDLPEEVAEKINHFLRLYPPTPNGCLCDLRELSKEVTIVRERSKEALFNNRYEYRFGDNAVLNGIWKNLIGFVHGYRNLQLPDLHAYQKETFVSLKNNEALIKLYPLPSPHNHAWYYSWLDLPQLDFLKNRAQYEEHTYPHRIQTILSNIITYKPELVLMYGMNNINKLKKSILEYFEGAKFKMIKATKQQIPQHHRADINGTTILITTQIPALRHNRIETGFDWYAFGKRVKSE
jgi:hypothetical protein